MERPPDAGLTVLGLTDGCLKLKDNEKCIWQDRIENTSGQTRDGQTGYGKDLGCSFAT